MKVKGIQEYKELQRDAVRRGEEKLNQQEKETDRWIDRWIAK